MDKELNILATDLIRTIEKEDAFYEAKKQGGFFKTFKAKNIHMVLQ